MNKTYNYPFGINPSQPPKINNHANKGMDFEAMINASNQYYYTHKNALVYKLPTPIQVVKTTMINQTPRIIDAYYKSRSTTDYIGIIQGKSFVFEAKKTTSKTRFYLNAIASHQYHALLDAYDNDALAFVLIYFSEYNACYSLSIQQLKDYIEQNIKSITIEQLKGLSPNLVSENPYCPIDYMLYLKKEILK